MKVALRTRRETSSGPAPENPYLVARSNFEGLFRDLAKEKHAWRIAALLELLILFVVIVAYAKLAASVRVVPYLVDVDRAGQAVALGPAEPLRQTDRRVIVRDLSLFVRNVRSVTTDPGARLRMIQDAYAYVDRSAAGFLNSYFADSGNDPRVLGQRLTREVQVTGVLPIPNSDSWKLQWVETERSLNGDVTRTTPWEAYVTVRFSPPTDAEHIQANPLGLYVTGINWTAINLPDNNEGATP